MKVQVRGRNIDVTDALRDYVEKRLGKLNKYIDNFGDAQVTMTVERGFHRVEVTIPINGMILRGEESTGDMYASVDLVVDKLEKQIERYKGRLQKRGARLVNGQKTAVSAVPEDEEAPKLVRTKRFAIKPMAVEEAILQMNLLGHSFFVFSNAETEQVNVVYRRKDGNYGLIEPEF
ncbi:MAG: ribosome-associated translation inhibitor RaiA [Peptococcaceae bacterium]|nr:ribosome-associated translation inhibitor RaiA [Peptococcaceae bacterium]